MGGLVTRIVFAAAALVVASLAAVTALGFFAAAAYLAFSAALSPTTAALATGGAALGLAAVAILVGWLVSRRPSGAWPGDGAPGSVVLALGDLIGRECLSLAKAAPRRTVGFALLAGFIVGAVPEIRQALSRTASRGSSERR